ELVSLQTSPPSLSGIVVKPGDAIILPVLTGCRPMARALIRQAKPWNGLAQSCKSKYSHRALYLSIAPARRRRLLKDTGMARQDFTRAAHILALDVRTQASPRGGRSFDRGSSGAADQPAKLAYGRVRRGEHGLGPAGGDQRHRPRHGELPDHDHVARRYGLSRRGDEAIVSVPVPRLHRVEGTVRHHAGDFGKLLA